MKCPHCTRELPRATPSLDLRRPWPTRRRVSMVLEAHRVGACVAPIGLDPYAAAWEAYQAAGRRP